MNKELVNIIVWHLYGHVCQRYGFQLFGVNTIEQDGLYDIGTFGLLKDSQAVF